MQIIDSHQHFWIYDPNTLDWISDDMKVIQKDFTPNLFKTILQTNGVEGSITVQVEQTDAETHLLIEEAKQNEFIKGVVGWIDLQDPSINEKLLALSEEKKYLKGFRHILQAEDNDFMLQPSFIHGLQQIAQYGYTYDIVIKHHQLPTAIQLVEQAPNVSMVLDHIGKPDIKTKLVHPWSNDIKTIASFPNVYCKISGVVTEADWQHWDEQIIFTYLDCVVESFGIDRIMFGSDWPVCLVACSYEKWLEIVHKYFRDFSKEEQEKVFANNCKTFYHI